MSQATIGKQHPEYATIVHNMALVYDKKGQYDKALEMCEEARAIYEVHGSCA